MPPVRRNRNALNDMDNQNSRGPTRQPTQRRRQAQQNLQRRPVQRTRKRADFDADNKPTPILLKILSWLGIALLCFVIGYLASDWIMDFMSRKLLLKPENRIENQEDLSDYEESEQNRGPNSSTGENIQQVSLNLYHVRNDTIAEARRNFIARTTEDNIRDAVNEILSMSEIPNANNIRLLHVFRNADTVFLDMSGQFVSALNSIGQRKSLLLLTGFVRTLQENFSPITQIRFLIDSKPPSSGGTVDLSVPWKMPSRSGA